MEALDFTSARIGIATRHGQSALTFRAAFPAGPERRAAVHKGTNIGLRQANERTARVLDPQQAIERIAKALEPQLKGLLNDRHLVQYWEALERLDREFSEELNKYRLPITQEDFFHDDTEDRPLRDGETLEERCRENAHSSIMGTLDLATFTKLGERSRQRTSSAAYDRLRRDPRYRPIREIKRHRLEWFARRMLVGALYGGDLGAEGEMLRLNRAALLIVCRAINPEVTAVEAESRGYLGAAIPFLLNSKSLAPGAGRSLGVQPISRDWWLEEFSSEGVPWGLIGGGLIRRLDSDLEVFRNIQIRMVDVVRLWPIPSDDAGRRRKGRPPSVRTEVFAFLDEVLQRDGKEEFAGVTDNQLAASYRVTGHGDDRTIRKAVREWRDMNRI